MRGSVLGLLLALTSYDAAGAVIVVDQTTLTPTDRGSLAGSSIRPTAQTAQTVTAGKTGLLSEVDLQAFGVRGTLRLSLYDGDLPAGTGTLVGSLDRAAADSAAEFASGGLTRFDVRGFGYHIVTGQVFSIHAEALGPRALSIWTFGYLDAHRVDAFGDPLLVLNPPYFGGSASAYGPDGSGVYGWTPRSVDRSFRTLVDVAGVPEPASWTMIVAGFVLLGGAVRRQRLAGGHTTAISFSPGG